MLENDLQPALSAETIYLKDYQQPDFLIPTIELDFVLGETQTTVTAKSKIQRQGTHTRDLVLNGEKLKLVSLKENGVLVADDRITLSSEHLIVHNVPDQFELEVVTHLEPHLNTELSGLYQSSGNFCTQCEAEGFRRITYFPDRPDVLSIYTVTITADQTSCPVLLSNGNFVEAKQLENQQHWVKWHDPHPKPSYLFALVAGDLQRISDQFTTRSGVTVDLHIYAEAHNIHKCQHAMDSLKHSMRWDEQVYGREYDLDIYNVVAVDDFNMGAMENKGLNLFNSKYVLADQGSATDTDYEGIESVIGHEYFHNWSGNRVTCRDWFQLSLKEGFTVFRDQEFSADMGSRAVKRIRDVQVLRNHQFKEDAGPMAHPVRPDSYQEIDNFYTVTVYEKGAEVIRMMHHLVGAQGFRKGTDLYFDRFDGCAVTTEDFVVCMEEANNIDLSLFRNWYTQAGTPEVTVNQSYNNSTKQLTLELTQSCPPTPNQATKEPFLIPLKVAFLGQDNRVSAEQTLVMNQAQQTFEFTMPANPTVSILRDFSAPIKLNFDQSNEELSRLAKYDNNGFVRFEALQRLALNVLLPACQGSQWSAEQLNALTDAFSNILDSQSSDLAMLAELLSLPSESYLVEQLALNVDPQVVCDVRAQLQQAIATKLKAKCHATYLRTSVVEPFSLDSQAMARRALRNTSLAWLCSTQDADALDLAHEQFASADNMTEKLVALVALVHNQDKRAAEVLDAFYQEWKDAPLVMDKWFALQAMTPSADTVSHVKALLDHKGFSIKNPNKVRSLLGSFAGNIKALHAAGGYALLADHVIELDGINPQVGSRLAGAFNNWRTFVEPAQEAMRLELERIAQTPNLSKNIKEIVTKALA